MKKPIYEIENKIQELRKLSTTNKMDVEQEIEIFSKKLEETKKRIYSEIKPWQKVQLARHPNRPYMMDYVNLIFKDILILSGDRRYADDAAIICGFSKIDDQNVVIIGTQKGRDTKENVLRNFGCPHPEGYRKAKRIMDIAEKAKIPIITIIDTPGAFPGIASEERHIGEAIAVNLREMFKYTVPIISIVIGEGGSGGALGIGIGNKILIMENAYYSVITPEGCAAILWKDRAFSSKAAESLKLTSNDLKEIGIADEIIPEPLGGAHNNLVSASEILKKCILKNLKSLQKLSEKELIEQRYKKYRQIGKIYEVSKN